MTLAESRFAERRFGRLRRIALAALALWFGAALDARPTSAAGAFPAETFKLANGLEVVVISDHRAPVVVHMLWYRIGAADDPPGRSGVAHFLEHMMFKGTAKFGPGVFSKNVARQGGNENAFTTPDVTGYHQTVASDRLELVMELEADRMRNLVFDPAALESERAVVLEERRQRTDTDPGALLGEHMSAAQYLHHPYRIPVIGWEHEIRAITLADLKRFYDRHYWPNNAVLVVAGDATLATVRTFAEKHYGPIPAGPVEERARPQEPPQLAPRRVEYRDTRVGHPSVQRSYLAPSSTAGAKEHAIPLFVLADVLGGGGTSRLYRELVADAKIATGTGASYSGSSLDLGRFFVWASPAQGQDLDAVEAAMDRVIAATRDGAITEDELKRAKQNLLAATIYGRDSVAGTARLYGRVLTHGRAITDIQQFPERVKAVTIDDVKKAAAHVFDARRSVTGRLLKADANEAPAGKP